MPPQPSLDTAVCVLSTSKTVLFAKYHGFLQVIDNEDNTLLGRPSGRDSVVTTNKTAYGREQKIFYLHA